MKIFQNTQINCVGKSRDFNVKVSSRPYIYHRDLTSYLTCILRDPRLRKTLEVAFTRIRGLLPSILLNSFHVANFFHSVSERLPKRHY